MRKTWFYRMLFSYLPVLFAISLSLLLLTYLTLNEMSKRSSVKASELLSQNILQVIDNKLKKIDDSMLQQLLQNEKIRFFFYPPPPGERLNSDFGAAAALAELVRSDPLISSVYLFRTSDYRVLTPDSYMEIEQFGDKRFIGSHINHFEPFRWETVRLYRPYPDRDSEADRVITLTKFGNLANGSLMVVNIGTDALGEIIREMSVSHLQYVELIDGAGNVIASKEETRRQESGEYAAKREPNGGKQLSFAKSDYTGWTIRSGINKANALEWVSSLFYIWVIFGFAVIAAGSVWLVYVTRRNYRPIQAIVHRLSESGGKPAVWPDGQKGDELAYIETAVEDLLDRSTLLQEENEENLLYRRSHVFLRLLDGRAGPAKEADWRTELERFGLDSRCSGLVVAVGEIDNYADFCARFDRRDQYLFKHVLETASREMSESESYHVWAEWLNEKQLGFLYMLKQPGQSERNVMAQADKLRMWAEQQLPFTITAGVGSFAAEFGGVTESYRTAAQLLSYKASLGCNRVLVLADFASRQRGETYRLLPLFRDLCIAYRTNDEAWSSQLEELRGQLCGKLFTGGEMTSLFHHLIDHLQKAMAELPKDMQSLWEEEQAEMLGIAARQETAEELFRKMREALGKAFDRMRELRESKTNHQLIRKVKQFISEHYGNPDLSLAHLSQEFGLGGSYMSRLFKEEFGVKFIDYITQVRVDQAIAMLKDTELTVQEIAEAVGYIRPMTFIRVFKKATGSTPGSYRKLQGELE